MRLFKKYICFALSFIFVFSCIMPCFANDTLYVWSTMSKPVENNSVSTNADTSEDNSLSNSLNLESASAILIEQTTGKVLYSHNEHEKLRPASVTKIMSILLIMEALDSGKISLTDKVPCSENAASMGGSQIWLDTTETLTVDEMLKAICVASANDRCCCNGRIYCRF